MNMLDHKWLYEDGNIYDAGTCSRRTVLYMKRKMSYRAVLVKLEMANTIMKSKKGLI